MTALKDKTLFITGDSRSIGKAIALRAASDGVPVVIAAKTAEPDPRLPGTIHSAAEEIEAASGTAAPLAEVGAIVREAERRWGTGRIARLIVDNPGDAASRVTVVRGDAVRISEVRAPWCSKPRRARCCKRRTIQAPAAETRGVLYGLQVGRFPMSRHGGRTFSPASPVQRWWSPAWCWEP